MGRTFLGELRKLAHPVAAIIVIVCFAFILTDARTTYHYARLQTPVAVVASSHIADDAAACRANGDTVSIQCQNSLDTLALNDRFASNGIALGRVNNSLSTWPGMLRFVTHQLGAGLGWILLAVLLALHVAGEWSSRTAASTLVATGSLRRFWFAKIATIWVAMIGITLLGTTVLYLSRSAYLGKVGIPAPLEQPGDPSTWHLAALSPDPTWSSWSHSAAALGKTSVIWLLFILAGAAIAGLIRRTLATVVLDIAALSTVLVLARYANSTTWSPVGVISRVLDLQKTPFGVRDTRLWSVPGAPGFIQDSYHTIAVGAAEIATWVVLPVLFTVVAVAANNRRRVAA